MDFTETNLSGARLCGSSFPECTFFGATLDAADFTGADLAGADLVGIEPPDQHPVLADAQGLDRARITARERPFLFS